ncbi:MAG: hypothetical protein JSU63_17560 [Phycisphaerales bacterium]|nr:MAG: hypothetical protein JSU63_17560 [Phycisphaerales bacterium]
MSNQGPFFALWVCGVALALTMAFGCGNTFPDYSAQLFAVPLAIEDEPIGSAVVDTGGGYEIMLSDSFGLDVVDSAEVVAFGGRRLVDVTEGFTYTAGGVDTSTHAAIVGDSITNHNAIGFHFFRKTGIVLGIDFADPTVVFLSRAPSEGITVDFDPLPAHLATFDTSFIEVEILENGRSHAILALLDTGASATMLRRSFVSSPISRLLDRIPINVTHRKLGSVSIDAALFEDAHLPDMILGTDIMKVWGESWYFSYESRAGSVTVIRDDDSSDASEVPHL